MKQKFYIKKQNLSKIQIIEFSILFIILNFVQIALKKIEELAELKFSDEKNQSFKDNMITLITEGKDNIAQRPEIIERYTSLINDINENSNIKLVIKDKSEQEVLELITDLINDLKMQNNLRKIESLEEKLINNLD